MLYIYGKNCTMNVVNFLYVCALGTGVNRFCSMSFESAVQAKSHVMYANKVENVWSQNLGSHVVGTYSSVKSTETEAWSKSGSDYSLTESGYGNETVIKWGQYSNEYFPSVWDKHHGGNCSKVFEDFLITSVFLLLWLLALMLQNNIMSNDFSFSMYWFWLQIQLPNTLHFRFHFEGCMFLFKNGCLLWSYSFINL